MACWALRRGGSRGGGGDESSPPVPLSLRARGNAGPASVVARPGRPAADGMRPAGPDSGWLQELHRVRSAGRDRGAADRAAHGAPRGAALSPRRHVVCHHAITSGQIDLYVEYTGTAYTAVLKHAPVADRDTVYRTVTRDYAQRFALVWGKPFGFNNTFAITVRHRDATRYSLRRISDLTRVAPRWKAGFGYEFLERADGFRGLASVYGLRFASPPTAMDLGLTYRALAEGKVDVIAGNSTDGQIQALDLVVLEDDRHYFPPYEAAPVSRLTTVSRPA